MTKSQFLSALGGKLTRLPRDEAEDRLRFYSEMIDDRMEEGLSEEEAVAAVGSVEKIAAQILADTFPAPPQSEPQNKKHSRNPWVILLLILGSPVWISLAVAALGIVISLYVSLWAVIISLWAVFGSLIVCAFSGIVAGTVLAFVRTPLTGIALMGAGLICAGLAIFLFYGCKAATNGTLLLSKKLVTWRKRNG